MAKKILELLYEKVLEDFDNYSEEYEKLCEKNCDYYERLAEQLDGEYLKMLKDFADTMANEEGYACETKFMAGVKVGVRLILECLNDN